MNLRSIRSGLETRLRTIPGLHVWAYAPDSVVVPAAIIVPREVDYHRAFNQGCTAVELRVRFYVSKVSDRAAQDALDDMLASDGTLSARAAIEADPTLGGVCTSVQVGFVPDSYASYTLADLTYLGFELSVEVLGS